MVRTRVLLADDHPAVAERLRQLIEEEHEFVGIASDGPGLVAKALDLLPDVIVTDISMPGFDGLEALRQLRHRGLSMKVIVLSMYADPELAQEAIAAGADGYVIKHGAGEELLTAIDQVLRGTAYVTPSLRRAPGFSQ